MWTRVASRVAGTTGEPFSSLPWWERTMWRTPLCELGIEAVDRLDRAADDVVAERDLAEQAAGVGEVDRERVVVVGLRLADVVQESAGDRDVAVDAAERRRRGADRLGDRDGVVEEPVRVGLVVVLRRRRDPEPGPDLRVLTEDAVEQRRELRVLDRRDELAQARLEPVDRDGRPLGEVVVLVLAGVGGADRLDRDLRAVALVDRELAADEEHGAGRAELERVVEVLPGDRLACPGPVAEHQAHEVAAVTPRPPLALANREHRGDLIALGEVADVAPNQRHRRGCRAERRLQGFYASLVHHLDPK